MALAGSVILFFFMALGGLSALALVHKYTNRGVRESALIVSVILYALVFVLSETLSAFNLFQREWIRAFWWVVMAGMIVGAFTSRSFKVLSDALKA